MKVKVTFENEEWREDDPDFYELANNLRSAAHDMVRGRDHGDYLGTKWELVDDNE